jgi:hypothetical protein
MVATNSNRAQKLFVHKHATKNMCCVSYCFVGISGSTTRSGEEIQILRFSQIAIVIDRVPLEFQRNNYFSLVIANPNIV